MPKKKSFIKIIQFWGLVFLLGVGAGIISFDIYKSKKEFDQRAKKMRINYIKNQKDLVRQEILGIVDMIDYVRSQSEELTREKIKSRVNEAYAIAENIYNKNKNIKNDEEIVNLIIESLRAIRFENGAGYYFATNLKGKELLFADRPEMEGLNLLGIKDLMGKYVIRDMINIARDNKEGFYEYHWTRPDKAGKDFKKISYIKLFEPFDFFIGTGLYVDDVESDTKNNLLSMLSKIRFGKEGYIFIDTMKGYALIANGEVVKGKKKLWQVFNKNPDFTKEIFEKEYKAGLKPEGDYIYYSIIKLTEPDKKAEKISFVYGISQWNWFIGTGFYLDDVEKEILVLEYELNKEIKVRLVFTVLIVISIVFISFFFFRIVNKKLKKDFQRFSCFFEKAASSDEDMDISSIVFEELESMAESVNKMIRDKKTAKTDLVEERERLFVTIQSIGDGVITTDISGSIVLMNRVAEELTGWELKDAKGQSLEDIFNTINYYTRNKAVNPVSKALESGSVVRMSNDTLLISKNKTEYQVADSAAPIKDLNGVITGAVMVFRNITEEHKIKDELKKSKEKFLRISENIKDVVFRISLPKAEFEYISPSCRDLFGYLPKEFYENSFLLKEIIHPDFKDYLRDKWQSLISGEKESLIEYKVVDRSGISKWVNQKNVYIYDNLGKAVAVEGVIIDVTDAKHGEEILKRKNSEYFLLYEKYKLQNKELIEAKTEVEENKRYFESIFDQSPLSILIFDVNGITINANSSWEKLWHKPIDEVIGKYNILKDKNIKNSRWFSRLLNAFNGKISDLPPFEYHYHENGKPALKKIIKGVAFPIMNKDKIERVVLIHQDITDEKRMEEALLNVEKLKSIGTLAGGIAHDFNNILMGLFGNLSLARIKLNKEHPALKSIEEAEKSLNRATKLTDQLLTFSKGGKPVTVDLVLEDLIIDVVGFDLSGSNIKPVIKAQEDLWPAEVDKGQIQQVFSNLAINAKQAMPDGGHLYIKLKNKSVVNGEELNLIPGKYIEVIVEDEGLGISKENLERIFDPYFTTKEQGSGLGLTTVYSIIDQHLGHIGVDSTTGEGTKFTIYLPASEEKRVIKDNKKEDEIFDKKGGKILIMDDEDIIRDVSSQMLMEAGYEVKTAEDGEKTIKLYKEEMGKGEPFDVVLMDLTIPGGMGGKDAVTALLKIDPNAKAIVSSGYAEDLVLSEYKKYGFKGIVSKPYTMEKLLKAIKVVENIH